MIDAECDNGAIFHVVARTKGSHHPTEILASAPTVTIERREVLSTISYPRDTMATTWGRDRLSTRLGWTIFARSSWNLD